MADGKVLSDQYFQLSIREATIDSFKNLDNFKNWD